MQGFRHCGGDAGFASRPLAPFDVHSPCFLFFPAACLFLRQADSHRWTRWGIGAVAAAIVILPSRAFRRIPANFLPLNQPASCRPPLGLRTAKSPSLSAKFYQTTCQTYPSMIKFCQKETSCAKCARFTRREIFLMIRKVVVAGGGVLGSQIAFQSAYCGFDVTIWLRSEGSIGRTQPKLDHLHQVYIDTINLMATPDGQTPANWANGIADFDGFDPKKCLEKVEAAYKNTHLELDMAKAVADADLVIESMAENVEDKISFYQKLAPLMPAKTVLVTNSSTLLPSKFAKYTGRPDEYLSLHFANSIWKNNIAEIMAQSKTDPKAFDTVMQFASDIRMIALPVRKEKSGYLLNSILVPLLFSAMDLYVNGISDPESIDKAWTLGTGAPKGPFHILDTVGLTTAHNIVKMYLKIPSFLAPYNFKGMDKMLKEYIDAGKLGQSSGEGFFKYEK